MISKFLRLLERCGRRESLVDAMGNVLFTRYYLLYHEEMDQPRRWIDYLPNVYLHVFGSSFWDGEDEHRHPWSALAVILRGGYLEHRKGRPRKTRWFSYTSYKTTHRIVSAEEGTVTLFFHGVRRQTWRHYIRPHEVICDYCMKENQGHCVKVLEESQGFHDYVNRSNTAEALKKFRTTSWIRWDHTTEEFLAKRRRVAQRMDLTAPETREQALELMTREFVKVRSIPRE